MSNTKLDILYERLSHEDGRENESPPVEALAQFRTFACVPRPCEFPSDILNRIEQRHEQDEPEQHKSYPFQKFFHHTPPV